MTARLTASQARDTNDAARQPNHSWNSSRKGASAW